MIAQLMAQRVLSLDPGIPHADVYRSALRLCAAPSSTTAQLARMQATLTSLPKTDVRDLCQQALATRRGVLEQEAQRKVYRGFTMAGRARLVGA